MLPWLTTYKSPLLQLCTIYNDALKCNFKFMAIFYQYSTRFALAHVYIALKFTCEKLINLHS